MKQRSLMLMGALLLMLFPAACGASPGNTAEKTSGISVPVSEVDFHIDSAVTSFSPGTRYHFVVTNNGKTAHEFMIIPSSQGSMSGMSMGDMDKMALASLGNVNPGETKTLDYTFPSSSAGSHPELACYLPCHYEAGMKQSVAVKS